MIIRTYSMPKLGHLQEHGAVVEWRKTTWETNPAREIMLVVETEKKRRSKSKPRLTAG